LNNQYTIFGEVVQGLDIALAIPPRDPGTATAPGEQIVGITIAEQ
jgi:cyclophilin family peptidyl-prolyl cis-trans isomerase